jgi:hypothetical protein
MGLYGGGSSTVIQAPPAPNYGQSMREVLSAQVEMADPVYQQEAQYQPLYNVLQAQQQAFQAQQALDIARQAYPQVADIEAAYNQANRRAELGQLQTTLPEYQRAFNALTPGYAEAVSASGRLAQSAMEQALNRPQFGSFLNAVRNPYGTTVASQQLQQPPPPAQQPPRPVQPPPPQVAQPQVTTPAPQIKFDADAAREFLRTSGSLRAPVDPGPPIEPIGKKNKAEVEFRNRQIDQYKKDLAAFNKAEAARGGNFQSPLSASQAQSSTLPPQAAAAQQPPTGPQQSSVGPQQPQALLPTPQPTAANQQQVLAAQQQGVSQEQISAAQQKTSAAMSALMAAAQQAQPQTFFRVGPQTPQYYSGLQDTGAGEYVNAVGGFTPANLTLGAGAVPDALNMRGVAGPQLASNIQNLDQNAVQQYIGAMPGMGDYANMLAQQSREALSAGKSLTAEEQRIADQTARAAYAARGTALGNQAIGAEILNRADVSNQRYQQRLQNAAQAAGTIQGIYQPALQQSLQRQQMGIDYGLGLQQQQFGQAQARDVMNQQLQQQRFGQLMGQQQLMQGAQAQAYEQAMGREQLGAATQQAAFQQALQRGTAEQQAYMAGIQAQGAQAGIGAGAMSQLQSAQAPILQAFYKQPILQGQEAQAQQMGMAMQQMAGPQFFNPESQTGMGSIYGAYNSQMNLAGAQAQANAASSAGKSAMWGQIIGAGIGAGAKIAMCWVAREVYGTENPRWTQFRDWMLANASDDFVDAYIQHGPKIAEFISDKPELKNMIRSWMDSKIS